jgi:cytochrome P450
LHQAEPISVVVFIFHKVLWYQFLSTQFTTTQSFIPNPKYFRFSGNREPGIPNKNGNANDPSAIPKAQPWATINDRFLGFGQGRHACPGRFFGAAMLQMILSYIMTEYDILEVKGEMKPTYFFGIAFSSTTSRMVVKKRTL